LAEHTGCAQAPNMLENTRTTYTNAFVHFFAWNMPHHAEHHAYPAVPFHALPKLGALLAAELDVRHRGREVIRERVEDVGRHLVHRMERFLNALGTIAAAGPLLGLFGTVVGMIEMFLGILDHGLGDAGQLAGGIGKALICTATGMVVAIPALAFHRYFRGRIAGYIVDMEHEAMRLQDVLDEASTTGRGRQD